MDCELEVSFGGNVRIEEMGTFIVGWTLGNTGMVGKEVVEGIGRAKGTGKDTTMDVLVQQRWVGLARWAASAVNAGIHYAYHVRFQLCWYCLCKDTSLSVLLVVLLLVAYASLDGI